MNIHIHPTIQLALVALVSFSMPLEAFADQIGVLYIKNSHDKSVSVWINGYYQGWVPSGRTCYTVREGFVTPDSGIDSEGNLNMEYDYAGWESRGEKITVTTMGYGEEEDTTVFWEAEFAEGDSQFLGSGKARFWVGTQTEITGLDMERATKIRKGGGGNFKLSDATGNTPAENVEGGGYDGGKLVAFEAGGDDKSLEGKWLVESSVWESNPSRIMYFETYSFKGIELIEKILGKGFQGETYKEIYAIEKDGTARSELKNNASIAWTEENGEIHLYVGSNIRYIGKLEKGRLLLESRGGWFDSGKVTLRKVK